VMYSTFPDKNRMYTIRGTPKWQMKNATKNRICFVSFFNYKQRDHMTYYVKKELFQIVKIKNYNNTRKH
jgi:hypothetical protein